MKKRTVVLSAIAIAALCIGLIALPGKAQDMRKHRGTHTIVLAGRNTADTLIVRIPLNDYERGRGVDAFVLDWKLSKFEDSTAQLDSVATAPVTSSVDSAIVLVYAKLGGTLSYKIDSTNDAALPASDQNYWDRWADTTATGDPGMMRDSLLNVFMAEYLEVYVMAYDSAGKACEVGAVFSYNLWVMEE